MRFLLSFIEKLLCLMKLVSDFTPCSCCEKLKQLDNCRFFFDDDKSQFVIIDNQRTSTPILIYKHHLSLPQSIAEARECFCRMNDVCKQIYGELYSLRVENLGGHFSIFCVGISNTCVDESSLSIMSV